MSEEEGPDLSCFDFGDSDDESKRKETHADMVKRHRQEEQALRTEAKARKHAIHKADKSARAEVDASLESSLKEMRLRHARELGGDEAALSIENLSVNDSKVNHSKTNKRRVKKEEEERERERRIADHHSGSGPSTRDVEIQRITEQLKPQGLRLLDITADGHCLYRSIAYQIGDGSDAFASCRKTAAQYIRSHANDFMPYILAEGVDFGSYCDTVENSNEWGGQLEITALANAHKRCVHVYSADAPVLVTCPEYAEHAPKVMLAYHKHYYGLGAHYNAVIPI